MTRLFPRFDLARWDGSDIDGQRWCEGWSLAFQWGWVIMEFNVARVRPTRRKAGKQ